MMHHLPVPSLLHQNRYEAAPVDGMAGVVPGWGQFRRVRHEAAQCSTAGLASGRRTSGPGGHGFTDPCVSSSEGGRDELAEQRVGARGAGPELWVELPGHEERMAGHLDGL